MLPRQLAAGPCRRLGIRRTRRSRFPPGAAASRNALLAAWVLHGALLVWGLWGEAPRFGFAPALSMTAWLVLTVYAVERQLFPQMRARWMLAALGLPPSCWRCCSQGSRCM